MAVVGQNVSSLRFEQKIHLLKQTRLMWVVAAVLRGFLVCLWSCTVTGCIPNGTACRHASDCDGDKGFCVQGWCHAIPVLQWIDGDGSRADISYPVNQTAPSRALEAQHRFRNIWILRGRHLDQITRIQLRSQNPSLCAGRPCILDTQKESDQENLSTLRLEPGDSTMRRLTFLTENTRTLQMLMAGMYFMYAWVGQTEVIHAQVFVLQGERGPGSELSAVQLQYLKDLIEQKALAYLKDMQQHVTVDASKKLVQVTGNLQIVNGSRTTESSNGLGNVIIGYNEENEKTPRKADYASGSHNLIVGKGHSYGGYGGMAVGKNHTIKGEYASVSAGENNEAIGAYSSVSGGHENKATGTHSSISAGFGNQAVSVASSVSGGKRNIAGNVGDATQSPYASVGGGESNQARGFATTVTGGANNQAVARYSSVQGGGANVTDGEYASISGGDTNRAIGSYSTIHGGQHNTTKNDYMSILGGLGTNKNPEGKYTCVPACL